MSDLNTSGPENQLPLYKHSRKTGEGQCPSQIDKGREIKINLIKENLPNVEGWFLPFHHTSPTQMNTRVERGSEVWGNKRSTSKILLTILLIGNTGVSSQELSRPFIFIV